MALVKCIECGNEVSDLAPACPKCGAPAATAPAVAPVPPASKKKSGIRFFTLVLLVGLAGAAFLYLRSTGKTAVGVVAGPQTLFSETVTLKEGAGKVFSFSLPSSTRVEISVAASPKSVNAYFLDAASYAAYSKARAESGGQFNYVSALSLEGAMRMDKGEIIPAGSWNLVVERPRESLLFGDDTTATVKIVSH